MFDRYTKARARRRYRLLILDGHRSHVTPDFIEYAHSHKILLMIFPPHSTHRLQPLDVALFSPLARAYSTELATFLQNSQGQSPVKKKDFLYLFTKAWQASFKESTILSSFTATGIWPPDASTVLKEVSDTGPTDSGQSGVLQPTDWRQIRQVIKENVREPGSEAVKELTGAVHALTAQVELLTQQNQGLQEQVTHKKKHSKKRKPLDLQQRREYHSTAVFWSPRKVREARYRQKIVEQEQEEERVQKARRKEQQIAAKLQRERETQERRQERERVKRAREEERAVKAAEKERQREARDAAKALQLSQTGKRKASLPASSNSKRQKRGGDAGDASARTEAPQMAPTTTTRSGRTSTLPARFV